LCRTMGNTKKEGKTGRNNRNRPGGRYGSGSRWGVNASETKRVKQSNYRYQHNKKRIKRKKRSDCPTKGGRPVAVKTKKVNTRRTKKESREDVM